MKKMLRYFTPVFLMALFFAMAGCSNDTNVSPSNSANDVVAGVLRDAQSGQPIVGAVISSGWATATTDSTGTWNLGTPVVATLVTGGAPQGYAVSINTANVTSPINVQTDLKDDAKKASVYPSVVYRNVSAATVGNVNGVNILTVGKQTGTVRGLVAGPNGLWTTGGKVELYYTETQANNNFGSNGTAVAGNLNGFVYKSADIGADGTFSFSNLEYGANYSVAAQNTAGTLYGNAQANLGNSVAGLVANVYVTIGTTDIQPQIVASISATVGETAANVTAVAGSGAAPTFATATAELTPGATKVVFTFAKAFTQAQLNYLATSQVGGEFYNDVYVQYATKAGNVPYTLAVDTTAKTIAVSFTTATSGLYAVDINAVVNKFAGFPGNNGGVTVATRNRTVFSTTGGTAVAAVTAPRLLAVTPASTSSASFTFDFAPVAGAKSYNAYGQVVETFVDGTTKAHGFTSLAGVFSTAATNPVGAAPVVANVQFATAVLPFTENDSVSLSYNVNVRAVNSDGLVSADLSTLLTLSDDPRVLTVYEVAAGTAAGNGAAKGLRPTAARVNDTAAAAQIAIAKTTATADALSGTYTDGTTNTLLKSTITFSEPMIKSEVENVAKWTITDTGLAAAAAANLYATSANSSATGGAVNVAITVKNVIYDTVTKKATIFYNLGWSFTSTAAVGPFSVTAPAFNFVYAGTDIVGYTATKGNAMNYGAAKGI